MNGQAIISASTRAQQGRLLPPPRLSELQRAHFRCIAELMVLRPKKIIDNPDRFDALDRAEYLEAFLGAVKTYAKAVVADLARAFPPENWRADEAGEEIVGFIPDETDRLGKAANDIVGALINAHDLMQDLAAREDD